MSSKFSRRSTRVQRKPHVCISEPTPTEQPTPPGPTGQIGSGWSFMNLFTFEESSGNVGPGGNEIAPGTWQIEGVDDQGNAFTLTVTATIGSPTTGELIMHGLSAPDNTARGEGNVWDGTLPFSDLAVVFTETGSLSGGGAYDIQLT